MENNGSIVISTFYHFVTLGEKHIQLKEEILQFCKENNLKGTILLAAEGINSTISGGRDAINNLYDKLKSYGYFEGMEYKESFADVQPFLKMKVRLKKEIVALGVPNLDVDRYRGDYISASDWDDFISQDDVVLIDTRNKYEIAVGTFEGAVDPKTATFREFPAWAEKNKEILKNKKIAMCCTGGIRCEKSTAYLKSIGYDEVYHLQGGILKYLEETKDKANKKWVGDCFVFDDRVAVTGELEPSTNLKCEVCTSPITTDDLRDLGGRKPNRCPSCLSGSKAKVNRHLENDKNILA
jgi:UPF0176 protein